MGPVAVLTDSTAGLSPGADREDIEIVGLHVLLDDEEFTEGVDLDPARFEMALRRGTRVRTSRPSPWALLAAYEQVAARGAEEIVSIHLSAQLSGTVEAAHLAAREAPVPVHVLDSRSTGLGQGFAVLEAARRAGEGATGEAVVEAARARLADTTVLCYVHTLEYLRRGGRIGAASSLLGAAFAVKPLIAIVDGHVEPVEKQRTAARALARLVDLGAHAARVAGGGPVDVGVHHVGATVRAARVAQQLADKAGLDSGAPVVRPLPAVLAAHTGPGAVAVVVSPREPG